MHIRPQEPFRDSRLVPQSSRTGLLGIHPRQHDRKWRIGRVRPFHFAVLLLFLLVAACGGPQVQSSAPEGFATYKSKTDFKAVSSDGVVYRVRTDANSPEASLAFWQEALKKRMLDSGYTFIAEQAIDAGANKGHLLELVAPVGIEDYSYAIAFFVHGKTLLVVEVAGEVSRFAKHKDAILKAIATVRLEG